MGFIGPASVILMHLSTQKVLDKGLKIFKYNSDLQKWREKSAQHAVAVLHAIILTL